uniref:Uncharacterized protein n=1 Tax=Melanopsichium pennsylvanicum 4 TaxID=1398559 RepID=A0A077R6A3_9BASI|nr:uncharacterized protein BN887_06174 [Melanopsichium pennsylvanicum 4]
MVIFTTTTPATNGASSGSYNKPPILPPETLTNILSAVELLSAMWSGSPESIRLKEALPEEIVLGLKANLV